MWISNLKANKMSENTEKLPIPELEAELLRLTKKIGRLSKYALELQQEIDRRKAL